MNPLTRKEAVFLALLALAAAGVFANTLDGEFIYDDHPYILENPQVSGGAPIFAAPTPPDRPYLGLYRPLVALSYRLNFQAAGFDPGVFHGTNILLHVLVTAGFYFLVRNVSASPEGAFLAALFFAVHPLHAEAVAWIVGRAELLAALFLVLAALCHRGCWSRPWLAAPAGLLYLAACLSKENALAFPAVLIIMDLAVRPAPRQGRAPRRHAALAAYALYGLVLAGVIWGRYAVLPAFGPQPDTLPYGGEPLMSRMVIAASILADALRLMVLPVEMRIFYHNSEMVALTPLRIGILAIFLALLLQLALKKRCRGVFWVAWIPASMVTVLNIVPIGAVFAERFLYLPSMGACAAAGLGLAWLCGWSLESPARGRGAAWVPVALAAVLGVATFARNPVYGDPISLWEDAVRKADFPYTHYNLGESYFQKGRGYLDYLGPERPGAVAELKKSLDMDPDHPYAFAAHFTLGRYYWEYRRDMAKAAAHLRQAVARPEMIERFPRLAEAYATLGQFAATSRGEVVSVDEGLACVGEALAAGFAPREMRALQQELEQLREAQ